MEHSKCLYPQYVRREGGAERLLPCGKCYNCRRKVVRTRQGQALAENLFPHAREHLFHLENHFLTLTYEKPPMTTPRPNKLGVITDQYGDFEGLWNGPFPRKDFDTDPEKSGGIEKIMGEPHWKSTGRLLTVDEIAEQHERWLLLKCGWSENQLKRWLSGDYEPQETTRVKDIQMWWDRCRRWFKLHRPDRPMPRYIWATEYGDTTERPHAHVILWGVKIEDLPVIYAYWEDYAENGFVHPFLRHAVEGATILQGRAATYQAKDLVKNRSDYFAKPETMDVEPARVSGSKEPPIGDGAYAWWLENWIMKVIDIAEKTRPPGVDWDVWAAYRAREASSQIHLPMPNGKNQTFPTTKRWRQRVRKDLGIPDPMWELLTGWQEIVGQVQTQMVKNNEFGKGQQFKQYLQELRSNSRRIQDREKQRVRKKRSELISKGIIRPRKHA